MAVAEEKCYGNLSFDTHNVINFMLSLVVPMKEPEQEAWWHQTQGESDDIM